MSAYQVIHHPKGAAEGSGHCVRFLRWRDGTVSFSIYAPLMLQIRREIKLKQGEYLGFRPVHIDTELGRFAFKVLRLQRGELPVDVYRPGRIRSNWATSFGLDVDSFGLEPEQTFCFTPDGTNFGLSADGNTLVMRLHSGIVQDRKVVADEADDVTVDDDDSDVYVRMNDDEWSTVAAIMAANNRKTNRTTVDIAFSAGVQAGVVRQNGVRRK